MVVKAHSRLAKRARLTLALNDSFKVIAFILVALACPIAGASDLTDLITRIKPSVVGIGTTQETRRPPHKLTGTGFVVGDGSLVLTNAHVLQGKLNTAKGERVVIFTATGATVTVHRAEILADDHTHDVALLRHTGPKMRSLTLASPELALEGTRIAFTGYPIGAILGLYPVTHAGIISAITPTAIPAPNSSSLSASQIRALRNPYLVYQLDATAYPGNSGSPLFDVQSGEVIGIINKVLIKKTKENLLRDPSNITYAIPSSYLWDLINTSPK
jgi:serine protease Do